MSVRVRPLIPQVFLGKADKVSMNNKYPPKCEHEWLPNISGATYCKKCLWRCDDNGLHRPDKDPRIIDQATAAGAEKVTFKP